MNASSTSQPRANLADLPSEILLKIFSTLSVEDLCNVSSVCRAFNSVSEDDQLWVPFYRNCEHTSEMRYMTWLRQAITLHRASCVIYEHLPHTGALKVNVVGAAGVGKTAVMSRWVWVHRQFLSYRRAGIDFCAKQIEWDNLSFTVWDSNGEPRLHDMRPVFYRGTDGVLLIYDLTRMPTVESLRDLIKHTRVRITKTEDCTVIPMIIVGNKADLCGFGVQLEPTYVAADIIAKEFGLPHTTTSALVNYNVEETFLNLAHTVLGVSLITYRHSIPEPLPNYIPSTQILEKKGIYRGTLERLPVPTPTCVGCSIT